MVHLEAGASLGVLPPKPPLMSPNVPASTFIPRLTRSLNGQYPFHANQDDPFHSAVPVSEKFIDIQKKLIRKEGGGVTEFYGGPIELHSYGVKDAWVMPAEVEDAQGRSNFHIVAVNCERGEDLKDAAVYVHMIPEHSLKLLEDSDEVRNYNHDLLERGGEKRVIIRPSLVGSLAYPLMATPLDFPEDPQEIYKRTETLMQFLGVQGSVPEFTPEHLAQMQLTERAEFENLTLMEPFTVRSSRLGEVQVNRVFTKEDAWFYDELLTFKDLNDLRNQECATMRLDSGCDSGMLYHDGGCDCHAQLIDALGKAREENGFVIHRPLQDGRGYGIVGKMETEARKQGVPTALSDVTTPQPTLQVAKEFYGDGVHDIRTFNGVGRVLEDLGFRNIAMITDNKRKVQEIKSDAPHLNVVRVPTHTLENGNAVDCMMHLEEKHNSDEYFSDEPPQVTDLTGAALLHMANPPTKVM